MSGAHALNRSHGAIYETTSRASLRELVACRSEVVTDEGAFHKFISIAALHTATEDLACPLTLSPRQATSCIILDIGLPGMSGFDISTCSQRYDRCPPHPDVL